jgi:serine/threonine-protein kinase
VISLDEAIPQDDEHRATSHGVMHAEDIGRARVFVRLAFILAVFGSTLAPLAQGDAFARKVMIAGTTGIALANAWLWRELRTDEGYTVTRAIAVGHVTMICAFGAFYFFGFFSAVAMVLPLGLFIFSLGQSVRATFGLYAACAALYGLLGTLTATGALADRGLLSPVAITFWDRIVAVAGAEGVLLASYMAARATRASTLVALDRHDQAIRKLGVREALLREARVDLDRALNAGGVGRFSDTQLGSFRLGRVLGRGGMGEVYEATHVATREPAAVKLLHARMLADPEVVRRFLRELKIASSIESVHVVRVLEIGGVDARFPYLAMELLRGEDLASILRHARQLPPRRVVTLARDVGEGLLAARRAGIVHRDLKPQNVFLAELAGGDRCWKILDFGVSKLVDAEGTQTKDDIVGTPSYMAPEQVTGDKVTYRTDLHALGAIAYRALTGRPAFGGEVVTETLVQVAQAMPPRPSAVARLHPAFDAVLAVALAKDPDARFDSGHEMADALEAASRGECAPALRRRAEALVAAWPWSEGS